MRETLKSSGAVVWILLTASFGGPWLPAEQFPATSSAQTQHATAETGTLQLALSGNRKFCVKANEIDMKPGYVKPRQNRNVPLVTTYGYKYQISASLRGSSAIIKLLESPMYRTTYFTQDAPKKGTPQPRIATPKDLKASSQPFQVPQKVPHWIPANTCKTLNPEYSLPLAAGRYDVYLGFDLFVTSGQWVPLQSDFVTDVIIEKGRVTRVEGRVDYSDGVRIVKLDTAHSPVPPGKP